MIHGIAEKIIGAFSHSRDIGVEDLVQEGLIIALEQYRRYDPARSRLSTWLHSVVPRRLLDYARAKGCRRLHERRWSLARTRSLAPPRPIQGFAERPEHYAHRLVAWEGVWGQESDPDAPLRPGRSTVGAAVYEANGQADELVAWLTRVHERCTWALARLDPPAGRGHPRPGTDLTAAQVLSVSALSHRSRSLRDTAQALAANAALRDAIGLDRLISYQAVRRAKRRAVTLLEAVGQDFL